MVLGHLMVNVKSEGVASLYSATRFRLGRA